MNDNTSAFSSDEYDDKIKRTLPYYEDFYRQICDVVRIYKASPLRWLDVGCGTGKMSQAAFETADIERFVFSDNSPQMIDIAKKRFCRPNTEFIISDVRNMNFCNEFDVVTAVQVNHYFKKEERIDALCSCFKALKKGGIFFSFENFAPFTDTGLRLYLNRWKAYQRKNGKSAEECEKHISRYGREYFPITITEHIDIMRQAGFGTAEVLWVSYMQAGFMGIKN